MKTQFIEFYAPIVRKMNEELAYQEALQKVTHTSVRIMADDEKMGAVIDTVQISEGRYEVLAGHLPL